MDEDFCVKIKDYDYSITRKGEVRNYKTGRILKWCLDSRGYYKVGLYKNGKLIFHSIHRLIALHFIPNPDNHPCIDHINNDRADNSISNLRWCSCSQNLRNMNKRKGTTSQFIGVSFSKSNKKWVAVCRLNGKQKYLGSFETEEGAAKAYNNFIIENNLNDFNVLNTFDIEEV